MYSFVMLICLIGSKLTWSESKFNIFSVSERINYKGQKNDSVWFEFDSHIKAYDDKLNLFSSKSNYLRAFGPNYKKKTSHSSQLL